jgi:predicted glycoside hydrolase/deacetylase ChbG (UPF0249 family)
MKDVQASISATRTSGLLIVNADDWGRDRQTTDRTLECIQCRTVSSVSAMLFMEDSERAAGIASDHNIDAGLHLNFTSPFTAHPVNSTLADHQERIRRHLRRHRLAAVVFHPGLVNSFEYVVAAQREEFIRLYGSEPGRIDGHHHMHLCSNMLRGKLLPSGVLVRRNFSFQPGEKSFLNRLYRNRVDRALAQRHRLTDFFFSLPPLEPVGRVQKIFSLAEKSVVEVETHPVNPDEHRFLTGGEMLRCVGNLSVAPRYELQGATS